MEHKKCSTCNELKPCTTEYFNKNGRGGYRAQCIECRSLQRKRLYAENEEYREQVKEQARSFKENNPDRVKEINRKSKLNRADKIKIEKKLNYERNKEHYQKYARDYYTEHAEEQRENSKRYYHNNQPAMLKKAQKYKEQNRDRFIQYEQKRRALKENLTSDLTVEEWDKTQRYFDGVCCYCGKKANLIQEHFVPLSKGGHYTKSNIVPSCKRCNSSKRDKYFDEWYPSYKHYSPERHDKVMKFISIWTQNHKPELVDLPFAGETPCNK